MNPRCEKRSVRCGRQLVAAALGIIACSAATQATAATTTLQIDNSPLASGWIFSGYDWMPTTYDHYPVQFVPGEVTTVVLSVFKNVHVDMGYRDVISPPFLFQGTSNARVSFFSEALLDSYGGEQSDGFQVWLERVDGAVPVSLVVDRSAFDYNGFNTTGHWYWDPAYGEEIWTQRDQFDVSGVVEPEEVYQLRFRTFDFDGIASVYYVLFGDVQISGGAGIVPGDATLDGFIDGADYTLWADNYLKTGQSWTTGDFSRNGKVDGADYTLWADNYSPRPPSSMAVVVPEPASLTLFVLGFGAVLAASCGRYASFGKVRATRNPIAGTALLS